MSEPSGGALRIAKEYLDAIYAYAQRPTFAEEALARAIDAHTREAEERAEYCNQRWNTAVDKRLEAEATLTKAREALEKIAANAQDPPPGLKWNRVREIARICKEALDEAADAKVLDREGEVETLREGVIYLKAKVAELENKLRSHKEVEECTIADLREKVAELEKERLTLTASESLAVVRMTESEAALGKRIWEVAQAEARGRRVGIGEAAKFVVSTWPNAAGAMLAEVLRSLLPEKAQEEGAGIGFIPCTYHMNTMEDCESCHPPAPETPREPKA
jgi:hypothetical protein